MLSSGSGAAAASGAGTSLLYSGEQYDSNLDQYYLRARYYNPNNGTFNRVDPYSGNTQDPQSLHKYAYVHNNPVNGIDPSGKWVSLIVWSAVSLFASYVLWSRIGHHSFSRWGQKSFYPAWMDGSLEIELYSLYHLHEIKNAGTYKGVDIDGLFKAYSDLYPKVTSRTCEYAMDDLTSGLKKTSLLKDIELEPAILYTNCVEPFNILVLVPTVYDQQYDNLKNPQWYVNNRSRQNIIFFYPGCSPVIPIGNLYDAFTQDYPWGKFEKLKFYNNPSDW